MSPHSWSKKESPALYTSSNNLMEDNSFSVYEAHMPVVFKSREIAFIEFLRFVYVYNSKIYNVNIGLQEKSKKKEGDIPCQSSLKCCIAECVNNFVLVAII